MPSSASAPIEATGRAPSASLERLVARNYRNFEKLEIEIGDIPNPEHVRKVIDAYRPTVLIGPDPRGVNAHADHIAAPPAFEHGFEDANEIFRFLFDLHVAVAQHPESAVGGDFKSMPLCRHANQTGCVVTYNSFRADEPPGEKSFLGAKRNDGLLNACNNPAALQGGSAPLDAYLETEWKVGAGAPSPQAPWTDPEKPVETPYVKVPGLLSGECKSDQHGDYLAITVHADPEDARVDDIKGDVEPAGERLSEWGLHIIDMELAMGDLIKLVKKQSAAWAK